MRLAAAAEIDRHAVSHERGVNYASSIDPANTGRRRCGRPSSRVGGDRVGQHAKSRIFFGVHGWVRVACRRNRDAGRDGDAGVGAPAVGRGRLTSPTPAPMSVRVTPALAGKDLVASGAFVNTAFWRIG